MARKIMDLAVCVGNYTDRNGREKGRWQNVGSLMKNNDGSLFLLLEKTFNPAGVQDGRQSVLINCFEPRNANPANQTSAPAQRTNQKSAKPPVEADIDDEIPF